MPDVVTMSESDLQDAVIEVAHLFGWRCAHFRAARTAGGWRTPVAADGAGWPDLTLVRERVVFVECKSARGTMRNEQIAWQLALTAAGAEHHVWTPTEWGDGTIEAVLRKRSTKEVASWPR